MKCAISGVMTNRDLRGKSIESAKVMNNDDHDGESCVKFDWGALLGEKVIL